MDETYLHDRLTGRILKLGNNTHSLVLKEAEQWFGERPRRKSTHSDDPDHNYNHIKPEYSQSHPIATFGHSMCLYIVHL